MPSFDVVSELDMQEVRNAVDQAQREVATRFDFKGTDTSLAYDEDLIAIRSATENRVKAALEVLKDKAAKGVSSQTQGNQVRVTAKKKDDLQAVIRAVKEEDFGIPLQFTNYRP